MQRSALAESDQAHPGETQNHPGPSRPVDPLVQEKESDQGGDYRGRADDEAGGAGRDGHCAVVQDDIVETDPGKTGETDQRQIAGGGGTDPAPDGEHGQESRRHQEPQEGQVVGRVIGQGRADAHERRGPECDCAGDCQGGEIAGFWGQESSPESMD